MIGFLRKFFRGKSSEETVIVKHNPNKNRVRIDTFKEINLSLLNFPNLESLKVLNSDERNLINFFVSLRLIKDELDKILSILENINLDSLSNDDRKKLDNLVSSYNSLCDEFNSKFNDDSIFLFLIENIENFDFALGIKYLRKIQEVQVYLVNLHYKKFPNSEVYNKNNYTS